MIVAGTGHRPEKLGGYDPSIHARLVTVAHRWLESVDHGHGHIEFVISGMALGWDQAICEACIRYGLPFDAYVPFKGQEGRWQKPARDNYEYLLAMARNVQYISGAGYAGWKMQKRNIAMVDACTDVLALYDGSLTGGTYNCITYAQLKRRPIHNQWSKFIGQA